MGASPELVLRMRVGLLLCGVRSSGHALLPLLLCLLVERFKSPGVVLDDCTAPASSFKLL